MQFNTKFNVDDVVCFKSGEGVMQGRVIGLKINNGYSEDMSPPSEYQISQLKAVPPQIYYAILVKPSNSRHSGMLRFPKEDQVAQTFEEAWKLS